jgi:hypothetical protein
MEEEFKGALATIWGVEDEDELPDSLQVSGKKRDTSGPHLSELLSVATATRVYRNWTSTILWLQEIQQMFALCGWWVLFDIFCASPSS